MSLPSKHDQIYGNCSVLHPDGTLMFRCDIDRINWYLNRNLAKIISQEPMVIQLTFMPKGKGHINEPFYLTKKVNCCVVCGTTENLTRHHAVPHCYRRHFPEQLKSRSSHDIVPCCIFCHGKYETEAQKLKKELAVKYKLPPIHHEQTVDQTLEHRRATSAAHALRDHVNTIPLDRQEVLRSYISIYLKKDATKEDIMKLAAIPTRIKRREGVFSHGKAVVEKIENLEGFIVMWRKHFCDTMNPKFLHQHWDINHRIQTWAKSQKEGDIKVRATTWTARFVGLNPYPMLKRLFLVSPKPADINTSRDISK